MSVWRWAQWLEAPPEAARLTLGEGQTPLIASRRIGPAAGLDRLSFKLESANPSGSYKDRFAAAAVSHMKARGQRRCVSTSSGNTGAALAAYCAAAEIACQVAVVETAPLDKLKQMLAYGARVFRVRGFGVDPHVTSEALQRLEAAADAGGAALQVSAFRYCPLGMAGVRTIAFELAEQSPEGLDHVFCPAGGGGLTLAVAEGFDQWRRRRDLPGGVRVHCAQPEGNNTIAGPLRDGASHAQAVCCTTTVSGLQVSSVIDGDAVIAACRGCGGTGYLVSDREVWDAQARLAREEGVFCEPAGAVALRGGAVRGQPRTPATRRPRGLSGHRLRVQRPIVARPHGRRCDVPYDRRRRLGQPARLTPFNSKRSSRLGPITLRWSQQK